MRFRDKNRLTLGWIPGPKEAWDKQSFFFPIIREGRYLAKGIDVYDASLETDVRMHVHYVLVGADMPERRALMRSSGHQGKAFCEYCKQYSLKGSGGGQYCPHLPPVDAPPEIHAREAGLRAKGDPFYNFQMVGSDGCVSKTDKNWRRVADFVEKGAPPADDLDGPPPLYPKRVRTQYGDKYGVKGRSIFLGLPGISFPWSFPPDAMHLFYENVVPRVVKHYRGVFFLGADSESVDPASGAPTTPADEGEDLNQGAGRQRGARNLKRSRVDSDTPAEDDDQLDPRSKYRVRKRGRVAKVPTADDDQDDVEDADDADDADDQDDADDEEEVPAPTKKPNPNVSKGRAKISKPKTARDKVVKFMKNDSDPYNIPPTSWDAYSRWIVSSQKWFPAEFGGALIDFGAHCHHLTADQWRTFTFHIAPIMMRPRIGDETIRARATRARATRAAATEASAAAPAPARALEDDDDAILGLPMEDFLEFVNLVKAIKSAVAYSHTADTINTLEERMLQFSRYV